MVVYLSLLLLASTGNCRAEDSPSLTRIKLVAERLNVHRAVSKIYSIDNVSSDSIGSAYVWRRDSSGIGVELECKISLNQDKIDALGLNDNALAWVIGHEMGHCELGTDKTHIDEVVPEQAWVDEYRADEIGKALMQAAGFAFNKGGSAAVVALNKDDSPTHPGSLRRLSNLYEGSGSREAPVVTGSWFPLFMPRLRTTHTLSLSVD